MKDRVYHVISAHVKQTLLDGYICFMDACKTHVLCWQTHDELFGNMHTSAPFILVFMQMKQDFISNVMHISVVCVDKTIPHWLVQPFIFYCLHSIYSDIWYFISCAKLMVLRVIREFGSYMCRPVVMRIFAG